jgi:AAA family ATP:ADP antiporter
MLIKMKEASTECELRYPILRSIHTRAAILFFNFFLIITALYQLKPASRSLFIESLGADQLPYVWIGTALVMGVLITYYHRLVQRHNRFHIVLGSCVLFILILLMFRVLLTENSAAVSVCFYIYVDILSVILVEQFWSLTNSIYNTEEGKRWYGFVGTGGLIGGVIGGGVAALLIKHTPLQTPDLLLVAAGIIALIFALTWVMNRLGLYCEQHETTDSSAAMRGFRALSHNRYLLLIAAILLLAQVASPLVEFQFLKTVEASFVGREARTAFLSMFFSLLGLISILVNLIATPLIHRRLGVIAGLLVQPLAMLMFSWGFMLHPTLFMGAATKTSDRGLSYSINRASKELLYVPIDPLLIYQAKAWIDMFGYRLFKILGSLIILLCTQWLPLKANVSQLSWLTLGICAVWIGVILILRTYYRLLAERSLNPDYSRAEVAADARRSVPPGMIPPP